MPAIPGVDFETVENDRLPQERVDALEPQTGTRTRYRVVLGSVMISGRKYYKGQLLWLSVFTAASLGDSVEVVT